MADEHDPDPPEFKEFDKLYNRFVRHHWHDPGFAELQKEFEALLWGKHRASLYGNKHIMVMIENARGHCRAAGVKFNF